VTFSNVNTIEQVFVGVVVKVSAKRHVIQMLGTRPENLVGAHRRPVRFSFNHCLFLLGWWGREVHMAVEGFLLDLDRLHLHGLDLFEIALVV
jgi:hypothetical protein